MGTPRDTCQGKIILVLYYGNRSKPLRSQIGAVPFSSAPMGVCSSIQNTDLSQSHLISSGAKFTISSELQTYAHQVVADFTSEYRIFALRCLRCTC